MTTPAEDIALIRDRVTRMDERALADAARFVDMRTEMRTALDKLDARVAATDARVAAIEKRSAWLTGVLTILGALAGWFAKAFTVTTGGK